MIRNSTLKFAFWLLFSALILALLFNLFPSEFSITSIPYSEGMGFWIRVGELLMFVMLVSTVFLLFVRVDKNNRDVVKLNSILLAIRNINQLIAIERDGLTLVEKSCRLLTEKKGFNPAFIIYFDKDGSRKLVNSRLGKLAYDIEKQIREGHYPPCVDAALKSSEVVTIDKNARDCSECSLRAELGNNTMSVRLSYSGDVYGVLVVIVSDKSNSDNQDTALLKEAAADIGLGIYKTRLEEKRSEAEAHLAASEIRYRGLFENIPEGVVILNYLDGAGIFIVAELNSSAEKIIRKQKEATIGRTLAEVFPETLYERSIGVLKKVWETGKPVNLVLKYSTDAQNDVTWCDLLIYRLPTGELVAVISDISDKMSDAEILAEREEKYLLLFSNMMNGFVYTEICSTDNGNSLIVREANDSFIKLVEKPYEEIVGRSLDEIFESETGDNHNWIKDMIEITGLTGKPFQVEDYIKELDKWIFFSCFRPKEKFVALMTRDISDRMAAENERNFQEERYRYLFESLRDPIALSSTEGEILDVNESWLEFFGYTLGEAMKLNTKQLFRNPSDSDRIRRELNERGIIKDYEAKMVKKDGTLADALLTSTIREGESGKTLYYQGIMRDLTEQKKLQAQLFQSQKMETVGRLAGGIAHDFNNLLTAIIGYTDLSLMELEPGTGLYADLEEILKTANRAKDLTSHLLAFSRRQIIEPKVLVINDILIGMDKMFKRLIGEDIELETILDKDLYPVKVDPGQIEQVLTNLVVNARDAMPDGGKLIIETKNVLLDNTYNTRDVSIKTGFYVMMAVSDTGIGMDNEVKSHVFEPFFTTKPKGKGTGLGLSTCYGIVKQNEGFIWVYSEPNEGTTFKIYFPRAEGVAESFSASVCSSDLPSGKEKILLVEDEETVRNMITRTLTQKGYTVYQAGDGIKALEVAENAGDIQLLITDIIMPNIGGKDLFKKLVPVHPEMKVLYMSGYTDNSIVHHGILDKGIAFIQKPFSPSGLLNKIRQVLDSKEL